MAVSAKVLVTGGAGFLGRGILQRVSKASLDWDVTVYSRGENKQYLCSLRYPSARYILGDVRDVDRLADVMVGHDFVIHAAAVKFIDRAELNAAEALSVNFGGSQAVVAAAKAAGVRRVVGISTDKAVQPVNTYGCSKMAMERLFAEASTPHTQFNCVRYGNVVGSTGSVIPYFQRQAAEEGRVTVTDPKMTRFWLGVDEGVDLVLAALASEHPGSIMIPLVRSMTMANVVEAVAPGVPVEIIGTRPGEKIHERLLHYEESVRVLRHGEGLELLPPGTQPPYIVAPFTLSSQNPHAFMSVDEMSSLVADAKGV